MSARVCSSSAAARLLSSAVPRPPSSSRRVRSNVSLLHAHALARYDELAAGVAGVGIGTCRFGDDADPGEVIAGLRRPQIGPARFDAATDTAEQIDLIADVEAQIVALAFRAAPRHTGGDAGRPAIAGAAAHGRRWQPCRTRLAQGGAGLLQIGCSDAQVGIGRERFRHQPVERRRMEQRPP